MNESAVLTPPVAQETKPFLSRLAQAYEALARREALACAVVLILTLGIRGLLLPVFPPPDPASHDEFSYLLAADTFASGRFVNPPLPFWEHFETFHELMQPVYASKYPILQGLMLAFGQKLFGEPWAGVYLSAGLMCAAFCWMLQGWISPNLAFLGALLFMLRIGIFSAWMNSYWGGAVAAIGGSLVLGALARILFRKRAGHVISMAAGIAILMHSRPWEGLVLCGIVLGVLAWNWRRWLPEFRSACLRSAVPALAILGASLALIGYVNYRTTGNALLLPHLLYGKQYIVAPMFIFQPLRPEPVYNHDELRRAYTGWHADIWRNARRDVLDAQLTKFSDLYKYFFGFWPLLIPPLLWPYRLKTIEERLTVFIVAIFLAVAVVPLPDLQPHYVAPIVGLFYLRFLQALSRLSGWRPFGKPAGWVLAAFFAGLYAYDFATTVSYFVRYRPAVSEFAVERAQVLNQLDRQPGNKLVMVRYTPDHNIHDEWVYNRADLAASPIVWAHEMGTAADAPLLAYFQNRRVWLLEADANPPRLTPYPAP